ncbi:MAG: ABC transporter substrate-binding protein [Alphaproteobacteria bacterium]|nr:ABC transporter substrate-binding protein [Alphaproteobacteria bacterium]
MRKLATLAFAFATALSTAAAAQTLSIGIQNEPNTMDPQWNLLGSNTQAMRNQYDTLIGRDVNLQLVPSLALSWKVIDDTTWEFKLRPGVKFHDGSDFTAEDVKFTLARIPTLPGNPSAYIVYTNQIKEVVVVDAHTVRFVTNGPAPLLPTNLSNVFMMSRSTGSATTSDFNAGKANNGTGPFKLTSWSPGAPQLLARNEGYWGEKPHWANLRILPIARDPARVAALLSGDVDFINRVPIADVPRLKTDPKMRLFSGPSAYVYMVYTEVGQDQPQGVKDNAGNPLAQNPWRNAKVREALSLAINRDALVDRVMEGLAVKMTQPVPEGMFGASPRIQPAAFSVERARALMAEAGFPQGFQAELSCPNDRFPNDSKICEAVAQQFSRIGLKITVASYPSAVFFSRRAKREFGLTMAGWGSLTGEASYFFGAVIHTADKEKNLGSINVTGISDPEIDPLIQRARNMLDDVGRRALQEQISEMVVQRNWVIPTLAFGTVSAGRADRVTYTTRQDEEIQAIEIKPAR